MNKKAIITDNEKAVVVLVIGESARKANFQLYGYQRDTNPLLSKQKSLKVYQATSCATYTTAGTKAILEPQNSDDLYELLPNYAFRTGVDVSWRTSNAWREQNVYAWSAHETGTQTAIRDSFPRMDLGAFPRLQAQSRFACRSRAAFHLPLCAQPAVNTVTCIQ